ncbi:hypothetical protein G7076_06040 [Sphingomonas sp. HDW15A]|uniref:hypothetical protein n=1 Tax=Sphingomonas sp. HDW15A TaxID=2714942 RepID=UPI00140B8814|nr:hypothetical protein [Sphingomonas sp. HDW15A]QIK96069.1 hypothetical protein G7076_06040 [Sphingomonas sp. HDW15A]
MDAVATESSLSQKGLNWLARERASGRIYKVATAAMAALLVGMLALSVTVLIGGDDPQSFLSPPLIALLLVSILIPAIALMVLLSRRLAMARAEERGLAGGRLHTRLVALFSVVAAVPTVMVAIFASLLFQSGLEFWFSDRAKGLVENSVALVRGAYDREVDRVSAETTTMSGDVAGYLKEVSIENPVFAQGFATQVLQRNLSEAIIFTVGPDGTIQSLALVNPYDRALNEVITPKTIAALGNRESVPVNSNDRIGALTRLDYGPGAYLYASRVFDPEFAKQISGGSSLLADYRELIARSRLYQLRFNGALLIGALLIVGLAIFFALKIADRLVRPVGELVGPWAELKKGIFPFEFPSTNRMTRLAYLRLPSTA